MHFLRMHSTLTRQQHQEINMTTTKDPQKVQQQNIDLANKFTDTALFDTLGRVGKNAMMQKGDEEGFESPIYKTAEAIGKVITVMGNRIKGYNSDTTITQDKATLAQANTLDKGIAEAKGILSTGMGSLNSAHNATSSTLFSRRVDESKQVLALLGNDTIMKEMRENYLDFVGNERSATVLNTFNKYGVMGGKEKQSNINTALDNRHSKEAVERLAQLDIHKVRMQELEDGLTLTHQRLSRDAEKIRGIRARKL